MAKGKAGHALEALKVFEGLVSSGLIKALSQEAASRERRQIFSSAVVVWMMIHQRLHAVKSLSGAVSALQVRGPIDILGEQGSLPARAGKISDNTGGYARARERLPIAVVENVADDVSDALSAIRLKKPDAGLSIFAIDGTTIRLTHSEKNVQAYPQYKNQHGEAHYPLMHVAIATNIATGVALRPEFGAYNGNEAVSEVVLSEGLLARLPQKSVVLGDRLYGTCRFAAEVCNARHSPIVRMRDDVAKKFIGTNPGSAGEVAVDWGSNRSRTGKSYEVSGRVIWHTIAESLADATTHTNIDDKLRRAFYSISRLKLPKRDRAPEPRKV